MAVNRTREVWERSFIQLQCMLFPSSFRFSKEVKHPFTRWIYIYIFGFKHQYVKYWWQPFFLRYWRYCVGKTEVLFYKVYHAKYRDWRDVFLNIIITIVFITCSCHHCHHHLRYFPPEEYRAGWRGQARSDLTLMSRSRNQTRSGHEINLSKRIGEWPNPRSFLNIFLYLFILFVSICPRE